MYLPWPAALLRFLQLSPRSIFGDDQLKGRKDVAHLGVLSPYHDAPSVPGVSADLPDDCTVDQVILLHRHGSRGPVGEEAYILQLVDTLDKAKGAIQADDLPPDLEFLKSGYKYDLVPQQLTVVGAQQLFDHGAEFSLRYPKFTTDQVISTTVPRVIDSGHFFSQGFFGRKADQITYLTTANFTADPVSWLTPWKACPNLSEAPSKVVSLEWAKRYVPPIAKRLSHLVPGVEFTLNDTLGALYACPYDLAARKKSPWCDAFTPRELRGLEYQYDLYLDVYTGHASRGDAGPIVGAFYVKKLIERLTDTNATPLYLDFGHDTTILFALSALGLNKDATPLSPNVHHPPADRKFRTSFQAPFAAEMVWEKFTCKKSFKGPQVRLVLNRATYPLSMCARTEKDEEYGTCSLDAFVQANAHSTSVEYNDATWKAACGSR